MDVLVQQFFSLENAVALLTLTSLEVVLGIDNIVFIAIIAGRLGPELRDRARTIGLSLAIITRLLLLLTLSFLASLTTPLFTAVGQGFSGRDLILLAGGVFLIYKATKEIHDKVTGHEHELDIRAGRKVTLQNVVAQILIIDIIFSLDSVITAVGMTDNIPVMALSVVIAVLIMLAFSGKIVKFIDANPPIKMLAISFLLMVGLVLVADGFGQHVPKGYIYFAMGFSLFVEMVNLKSSRPPQ